MMHGSIKNTPGGTLNVSRICENGDRKGELWGGASFSRSPGFIFWFHNGSINC